MRSCNTLDDLSNRVCVPNEIEDLNIHVFNMTTGKNEPKILTKDISYKCKCRFDAKKCNSDQCWNDDKCWCDPGTCSCENSKSLASVMDDLAITCDEIINAELKSNNEETKIVPTDFN